MRVRGLILVVAVAVLASSQAGHAVKLRIRAQSGDAVAHVEILQVRATQGLGLAAESADVLTRNLDLGVTVTSWNSIIKVNPDGTFESIVEDTVNELMAGGQRVNPAVPSASSRVTFDSRGIIRKSVSLGRIKISGSDRSPVASRAAFYIQFPAGDVRPGQQWSAKVNTTAGAEAVHYRLLSIGKESGATVGRVQVTLSMSARQLRKTMAPDIRELMEVARDKQYPFKGFLGEKEMAKSAAVSGAGARLQGTVVVDLSSGVVLRSSGTFMSEVVIKAGQGRFSQREQGEWSIYLTAANLQVP